MQSMRVVAFIPIRLNSKRVAGKNLKKLGGKPLISYVTEILKSVQGIDEIYVYCSSKEITEYLPEGVHFLKRDESLDADNTLGKEIYDAFVKEIDADIYILSHATSPFIKAATIQNALNKVKNGENDSAFSAEKIQTFTWFKNKPLNYALKNIPRTQDLEPVYVETSAFFIYRKEVWTNLKQRIGEKPYIALVDKIEGVDIDTPEDFEFAQKIVNFH